MRRLVVFPVAVLILTGCGAGGEATAVEAEGPVQAQGPVEGCRPDVAVPAGRVLLQAAPQDVPGPFYNARTDGPCALVVSFSGVPEGDGPCKVASYAGRLDPAGQDLRLLVEEVHTGGQPDGDYFCPVPGANRWLRVELDEPLDGRRLIDAQGHQLHLVNGDALLRPGHLPAGWATGVEGTDAGGNAYWSYQLRGPGELWGTLRQGPVELARQDPGPDFGYRELDRPKVRGVEGVLGAFQDEPGNHLLRWVQGDQGFVLQVLGPLPDPGVLVQVANGLQPA